VLDDSAGVAADGWARAYFAGFSAFTLGVGDDVPNGAVWQLLTVVAVISGLALTTMSITSLVPVVTAVTNAASRPARSPGGEPARTIWCSTAGSGAAGATSKRLAQLADAITLTAERHRVYPILPYYHSAAPDQELRAQLRLLDDGVTLLQLGVRDGPHPAVLTEVRRAVELLLERAGVPASDSAPPPLTLTPLRAGGPSLVEDDAFAERLSELEEHRQRLHGFAAETRWQPGSRRR
jgi:hypothetical protein